MALSPLRLRQPRIDLRAQLVSAGAGAVAVLVDGVFRPDLSSSPGSTAYPWLRSAPVHNSRSRISRGASPASMSATPGDCRRSTSVLLREG